MSAARPVYTDDEMAIRIWDKENIRDLMARRAFYLANEERRKELDTLWVNKPENRRSASFGRNWGYYIGMDEIIYYYVVKHDKDRYKALEDYCKANQSLAYVKENLGYGCMNIHPVSTPRIVIAGDGKTARGIWYSIGQETIGRPDGTAEAMWFGEVICGDFIKEDGSWKIWHLYIGNDFFVEAGTSYAEQEVYLPPEDDWASIEFGTPTMPMPVHDKTLNWADNYPLIPQPYQTFTDENSYGPKGHLNYKEAWEQ